MDQGGKLVVHQWRRIFVGREVSSAAAVASRSASSSCVRHRPQLACGEMFVSVSPRVLQVNKNGCSMNEIG